MIWLMIVFAVLGVGFYFVYGYLSDYEIYEDVKCRISRITCLCLAILFAVLFIASDVLMFADIKCDIPTPNNNSTETVVYDGIKTYEEINSSRNGEVEIFFENDTTKIRVEKAKVEYKDTDSKITRVTKVTEHWWSLNTFTELSETRYIVE